MTDESNRESLVDVKAARCDGCQGLWVPTGQAWSPALETAGRRPAQSRGAREAEAGVQSERNFAASPSSNTNVQCTHTQIHTQALLTPSIGHHCERTRVPPIQQKLPWINNLLPVDPPLFADWQHPDRPAPVIDPSTGTRVEPISWSSQHQAVPRTRRDA